MGALDRLVADDPGLAVVTTTHHLEELPASTTHALLLRDGAVVAIRSHAWHVGGGGAVGVLRPGADGDAGERPLARGRALTSAVRQAHGDRPSRRGFPPRRRNADATRGGERSDEGDRLAASHSVGDDPGRETADDEAGVTPEAVDAYRLRPVARLYGVGHSRD